MKYYIHNTTTDITTEVKYKSVEGQRTWIDAANGTTICPVGEESDTLEVIRDTQDDLERIAQSLKKLRTDNGYTVKEMEKVTGIKNQNFCIYESGKRNISIDVLTKMLEPYGLALAFVPKEFVK